MTIGQSTKSGSVTKSRIKTEHLSVYSSLEEVDARMMYQAYRLGQLPEGWKVDKKMSPIEFIEVLDDFIRINYDINFVVRIEGQPLLIVFAKDVSRFLVMGDAIWWPKTSDRLRVESVAAVLNEIRKKRVALIEAKYDDKKFYEMLSNHKILRRIGSLYDTIEKNSRTTFFQTRAI